MADREKFYDDLIIINLYLRHLKVFEFKILLDKQKIPTFSGSTIILLVESIDVCVNIF